MQKSCPDEGTVRIYYESRCRIRPASAFVLVKQGYSLYFYKNEKGTLEIDFFIRDAQSLVPVEVKAADGSTVSLNNLIDKEKYADIHYGIKLGYKNIGYNGKFYTFPYFLTFLLKRFMRERGK